ncbi:MAG: hypothetical protein JW837_15845 [Sedimentisphaerales bacterium]|nr:hypothetical protein [Sedimentisphaerales bacterium]
MKIKNENTDKKTELYSIDKYKGRDKWCFAIVLNKAQTNLTENPDLFEQTITKYDRIRKEGWFDEETKKLIYIQENEHKIKGEIKTLAREVLKNLRNYFSHHFYKQDCLIFPKDNIVRIIMGRAYERSEYEIKKNLKEDISIELPALFEPEGKITTAGIVFFTSFFVERRFLHRLMGSVQGFTKTEGEYKITRDVFAKYCLRDSYSVKAQDNDAVMFRDIIGYLSRVPTESFQHIKNPKKQNESQLSERKTDKFISFALKYLKDYGFEDLKGHYTAFFARSEIKKEKEDIEIKDDKKHKPHRMKSKIEIHFDKTKEDRFYIERNNVILKIQRKGGRANILRMGIYELKYLVLLCLSGKAREAINRIDDYLNDLRNKIPHIENMNKEGIGEQIRSLPGFVRSQLGFVQIDDEKKKENRLDYVEKKWEKKRAESKELKLNRKGRDILRYINERCKKPLTIDRYNRILELLVEKNIEGFYHELEELRKTGRIEKNITQALVGEKNINALHIKICKLVQDELKSLEKEDLKKYIGLTPKEEKVVSFEEKLGRILDKPVIYKGFLRYQFFKNDKKSFARLVEEIIKEKTGGLDVPIETEYYSISTLGRFDKANKTLYETLAMDRLCMMMARRYFLSLNKILAKRAQNIEWKKESGKEFIVFKFNMPQDTGKSISIRFSPKDYTKLYVKNDSEFLARLCQYFFPNEKAIDYHKLYSHGINKYTNFQKEGIEAILELEEKIIKKRKINSPENYLSFEEILNQSIYNDEEKNTLIQIRHSLLHYQILFSKNDLTKFYNVMKREGIEKIWSLVI